MVSPLLMDLYELTMAAGYVRAGMHEKHAIFDLFYRTNPFEGGFAVCAGIEPALEFLEDFRLDDDARAWIASLGLFDRRFMDWIATMRFTGRVTAVPEGEIVSAGTPLLSVEGPLAEVQIVETALLNLVNFQTLVATKAARLVQAAGEGAVVEFGARRAQGPDGALGATRAAFVGGVRTTSHLDAGRRHGISVAGTQAHSWVMAFDSEIDAFRAYAETFPDRCVLLVDTYDTLASGVPHAITVAKEMRARGLALRGIRIDSGDLAALSAAARRMLDAESLGDVKILASGDLDEHVIASCRGAGGKVDLYGVGTRLVTAAGPGGGALGGVYKLVECDGRPRVKVTSDPAKATLPGRKAVHRIYAGPEPDAPPIMDVLSPVEDIPRPGDVVHPIEERGEGRIIPKGARCEEIRTCVMRDGRRTREAPPLEVCADRARAALARLPEAVKALTGATCHPVMLSDRLRADRRRLATAGGGGGA